MITTYSGKQIDLSRRELADDLRQADIVWILAHSYRFWPAVPMRFYSIAEHAVLVSLSLEHVGAGREVIRAGLHHADRDAFGIAIQTLPDPWPVSVDFHNRRVLRGAAHAQGLELNESWAAEYEPEERVPFQFLEPQRAFDLYMARYEELSG